MGLTRQNACVPAIIPDTDLAMYQKAGCGHRIGFGSKLGIAVVDMTRAFVEDRFALGSTRRGQAALKAIQTLLGVARPIGIPIFFTRMVPFTSRPEGGRWFDVAPGIFGQPGDPAAKEGAEIPPETAPQPGEPVIAKAKPNAYFGTQLHSVLVFHQVDTLIVTGMVTSGCTRATVDDAFAYNYRVLVPRECVAGRAEIPHEVDLFDMDMISADVMPLDAVLAHLRAVDRRLYARP